jgi:hypothetical protein
LIRQLELIGALKFTQERSVGPATDDHLLYAGRITVGSTQWRYFCQAAQEGYHKNARRDPLIEFCKGFPKTYMQYCRGLNYDETPNYNYLN